VLSTATSLIGGGKQQKAASSAQNTQLAMFQQTRQDLQPFVQAGQGAIGLEQGLLGIGGPSGGAGGGTPDQTATLANIKQGLQSWSSAKPGNAESIIKMIDSGASLGQVQSALSTLRTTTTNPANTKFLDPLIQQAANPVMGPAGPSTGGGTDMMARLAQTPGYQFALQQGLQATQSGFAAQGLGQSGAALKGAAQYSEGLASTTYQQQVQNAMQAVGMGQSAAAGLGSLGQTAAAQAGQFGTSGAAAGAAGVVGAGNALGGALQSAAISPYIQQSLQSQQLGMYGNSGTGAGQFTGQMPQINANTFSPTYTPAGYAYGS
jgi:hypothetical protein